MLILLVLARVLLLLQQLKQLSFSSAFTLQLHRKSTFFHLRVQIFSSLTLFSSAAFSSSEPDIGGKIKTIRALTKMMDFFFRLSCT